MDYAGLKAAVASYTKRGDTAALIDTWIALTEATLNRELRSYLLLKRANTFTLAGEFTPAPADLNAVRSARLTTTPFWQLDQLTPEQMEDLRATQPSGVAKAMCVQGGEIIVSPVQTAGTQLELLYYTNVPGLTASNTTNAIIAQHPDLYLWGVLTEAWDYYEDDDQLQKASGRFKDALTGANLDSVRYEASFNLSPSPSPAAVF